MMATYTLFAGVNGAGKTSIYKSVFYKDNSNEKRINTDEMVSRIGSWEDKDLQIKCGREAVRLIREYLKKGISFNQETTLTGNMIIRNIVKAKSKGFNVIINYIGVESPEIAKERVKIRVNKGGHGISEETIERRYYESLNNLNKIISLCDKIYVYDNSIKFKQIMYINSGKLIWKTDIMPNWTKIIQL